LSNILFEEFVCINITEHIFTIEYSTQLTRIKTQAI